jgi:lysyl-tRNA synthetase class 2
MLKTRAKAIALIRQFMTQRDILEVSTPAITRAGVTEPNIESLALNNDLGYLRTSPEYYHKRLLASGVGDLYEIGPVFRAGEQGRWHRPEFTLLEWYRVNKDWRSLAEDTLALVTACSEQKAVQWKTRWVSWADLFKQHLGFDPLTNPEASISLTAEELPEECDSQQRLDFLFSRHIQTRLSHNALTVVHSYPAAQAALACLDPKDHRVACRFEVFAGTLELANGYQELTDAAEQRRRFELDNERRRELGRPSMPIDEDLLAAMKHGLPDCAGVALGIERLLLTISGSRSIEEVMAFS